METLQQLNRVQLRGIIGSIKVQNVGCSKVARLTVATNYAYKDAHGYCIIETTWHNVTAWEGKTIQCIDRLGKGTKVEISGRLKNQRYIGEDGMDRYTTEILAQTVSIITEPLIMEE